MSEKKVYKTVNVGTIWLSETKGGDTYISVPLVEDLTKSGEANKYKKIKIYAEVMESGEVYEVKKFKTFNNDKHESILADLCVELNDENYSVLVDGE